MAEDVELLGNMSGTDDRATPLLAVCIPTHNRREVLEECLESVLPQADLLGVGVIVSDNCSSDGTWQALQMLKLQYPWMQIMRHTRDIGARDNLTGVVLSSRAHYVWPIGDKYVLLPGALEILVAELVRLHPDAVVVNAPDHFVSTGEKIYSTPQACLTELGWWTTLTGATVLPRQAWVDTLRLQSPNSDFPQVIAFFSYLASLSAPQILFSGRVLIQVGKSVSENHVASSMADHRLETWGRNLYDTVMSLPALYSASDKLQMVRSFSEHEEFLSLVGLVKLRVQGQLTLQRLNAEQVLLRAIMPVPWWAAVIISVVPRWMLRPLMGVHPRLMLRAMRRRLRLPRGQQPHQIVH